MYKELTRKEIEYNFEVSNIEANRDDIALPEYKDVYEKIKTAFEIESEGYNLFLIDKFTTEKKDNLLKFIGEILSKKDKPMDICYLSYDDVVRPIPLYLSNGKGKAFVQELEDIQEIFLDLIFEFYNGVDIKEKEDLLDGLTKRKNELLAELIEGSKEDGFEIRPSDSGFAFLPLKEGKVMTDDEYDMLDLKEKDDIVSKVGALKIKTKDILNSLKDIEESEVDKIKVIMRAYLEQGIEEKREEIQEIFEQDPIALEYLEKICNEIIDGCIENYSTDYDKDEVGITELMVKYKSKVIVDNSNYKHPRVIYEEDPSISKLIGTIDIESSNGNYVTSIKSIKAGSLLKANQGCIIVRLSNLLDHSYSYFHLKKSLLTSELDLNYSKGYVELFALGTIKPKPVKLDVKVILIGDYESYELLYNYDEDFRRIFKVRTESNPIVNIDKSVKEKVCRDIYKICKDEGMKEPTEGAIKELAKYLSRKGQSKNKVYFDSSELKKVLMLANNDVKKKSKEYIDEEDIISVAYPTEIIEEDIMDSYRENKVLISLSGNAIGKINGLSVIDLGYASFGKPIRITCSCYKGNGEIIDAQKEGDLSGKIHNKAISILKGLMNNLIGGYESLTVDFHLSFEQIYGLVEGDSASVGEAICMISALSKIPIKQNMAITGSINQFGEVQPIGGVNEKIEGFYKACKVLDDISNKAVVIPEANKNDIVLNTHIEKDILEGKFKIYTIRDIRDAIDILMDIGNKDSKFVIGKMKRELKKYEVKKKNDSKKKENEE